MGKEKNELTEQLQKLDQKLSNPKELIQFSYKLASNLVPVWASGDYYKKIDF